MSEKRAVAIGVDIGGSFFKAGLVTRQGEIVARERLPVRKEKPEDFYAQLCDLVNIMIGKAGDDEIVGLGIGVAGWINRSNGRIEQSPNIHILDGTAIFDDMAKHLPLPAVVDNDANVAAWGEYLFGAGAGAELLVLLTLGSGIGGGIVWRGKIWRGTIGFGGELGHTVITPDGPLCGCGRRGCLEAEFSDTAFARKAKEAIEAGRATSLASIKDRIYGKAVTDAAVAGDEVALEIVTTSSRLLGLAVANIINGFNPDHVVLGGGLIAAADLLMPRIMAGVKEQALVGALAACDVRPSTLGNSAGLLGAAGLAWGNS